MSSPILMSENQPEQGAELILLLVDDEPNILSSLSRLFRKEGYQLLTANNGHDGLALLEKHPVGVVLSDQRMPEMLGSEFLSKARAIRPESIRIILSGYTELNSVITAINEGAAYKFLTKPWDDELLRQHIRDAFEQYQLRHENKRLTTELEITNKVLCDLVEELEKMVAKRTQEVFDNLSTLHVTQEIIDKLPLGIIGMADDGLITLANQEAITLLGNAPLLAMPAVAVLPKELIPPFPPTHSEIELGEYSVELNAKRFGDQSTGQGWIILLSHKRAHHDALP